MVPVRRWSHIELAVSPTVEVLARRQLLSLDTYSHVAPSMQASATAKLSQLLFPALRIVKDDAAA
jgi:hypothetical protein